MQSSSFNAGQRPSSEMAPNRSNGGTRSTHEATRLRSDADSWVEISSQPSSSSLSSAATDEIVTTGLRVRQRAGQRRRRFLQGDLSYLRGLQPRSGRERSVGSSQDEYEESESEDERAMTSSSEHIEQGAANRSREQRILDLAPDEMEEDVGDEAEDDDDDDDDDEHATALGVPNEEQVFTPQPNAFSHPPSSQTSQQPGSTSYFPPSSSRASSRMPSLSSRQAQRQHTPYNAISPSYQADHDAALRASLSTLLSCAAAARGLPKQNQGSRVRQTPGPSTGVEPSTLRIVPESTVMDTTEPITDFDLAGPSCKPRFKSRSSSDASTGASPEKASKGKRKAAASPSRGASAKDRAAKKPKRIVGGEAISPTLLTWVVSAGVVVLVSALGFSAGYAIGKEVGRAEVGLTAGGAVAPDAANASSCGREVAARGLRRLRWGTSGAAAVRV